MNRAYGYCRVSTNRQAEEGISLDLQKERITAYAIAKGLKLTDIIVDGGRSGKNLKNRPGIQRVFNIIQLGKAEHVICYKLDRAFRSTKDALKTVEFFQQHEITFHSVCESIDTQSANGILFYTILCAMAQWERQIISERVKDAWKKKRSMGQKTGGYEPYGLYSLKGKLLPCESEQKLIESIRYLRSEGHILTSIADQLNQQNILTKTGKQWTYGTVSHVLRSAAA